MNCPSVFAFISLSAIFLEQESESRGIKFFLVQICRNFQLQPLYYELAKIQEPNKCVSFVCDAFRKNVPMDSSSCAKTSFRPHVHLLVTVPFRNIDLVSVNRTIVVVWCSFDSLALTPSMSRGVEDQCSGVPFRLCTIWWKSGDEAIACLFTVVCVKKKETRSEKDTQTNTTMDSSNEFVFYPYSLTQV